MIRQVVDKYLNQATSPHDLYNIAKKKCNIFLYKDIKNFDDIDELFEQGASEIENSDESDFPFDDSCVILLYNSSPSFGHWCCLTRNEDGYNFLDSYGDVPDFSLDIFDQNFNKEFGQDKKYLAGLLSNADEDVFYNHIPLQKLCNNIATCGRYCALYLQNTDMNIDDFAAAIKNSANNLGLTNDEFVVFSSLVE